LINNAGLADPAARRAGFITGQNFVVDGGMRRKVIYL
jgi:NAD(P)-dependent dehydrogenase (short-subunit alcohol dehydrogenase family)